MTACVLLQGLELLVTVLLARNRQPPPPVAAGVPHAELAAELLTLPSGLLAMVCEAIVKLKVCLGAACARVRVRVGHRPCEGPTRSRRVHCTFKSSVVTLLASTGWSDRMRSTASTGTRGSMLCRFPMCPRE